MEWFPRMVAETILPLSKANSLPEAFEEWSFTGNTLDRVSSMEHCQLCHLEGSRYALEIKNAITGQTLLVGTHCILKYEIAVIEHGARLPKSEARIKLTLLMKEMRLDSCLKALDKLAAPGGNIILRDALEFFRTNHYLTPRFAFVVYWKLRQHEIDHCTSYFTVNTVKARYKKDLRDMETSHVHYFWDALTKTQQRLAVSMGHTPPDELGSR